MCECLLLLLMTVETEGRAGGVYSVEGRRVLGRERSSVQDTDEDSQEEAS